MGVARRLQIEPVMSDKWIKQCLESQRRRRFHDVIVLALLAGGMAVSFSALF